MTSVRSDPVRKAAPPNAKESVRDPQTEGSGAGSGSGAVAPPAPPLDNAIRLVTPERISFQYRLAGPAQRWLAYLADLLCWLLLVSGGFLFLSIVFGLELGLGVFLIAWFVLQWGYNAFFEIAANGRTPGKMLMKLRVVSERGVPITPFQALMRSLLLPADGWPFAFIPCLISMSLTRRFQRLGDLAAGTMVVIEDPVVFGRLAAPLGKLLNAENGPEIREVCSRLPRKLTVRPEIAQLLSDYVIRRHHFHPNRREEICSRLAVSFVAHRLTGLDPLPSHDALICAVWVRIHFEDLPELPLSSQKDVGGKGAGGKGKVSGAGKT